MIALCGIIIGLAAIIAIVRNATKRRMPTDQEVNDLTNRLNRMALKRGSK